MLSRCVALLLAAALAGGLGGCTSDDPAPAPEAEATPLEDLDARALDLSSAPFCERIGASAVEAAVGTDGKAAHWSSGDTVRMTRKVRDVAHENGCQWTGTTGDRAGDRALAWAFVPPVTVARAKTLVRDATRAPGCEPVTPHRFGRPATGTVCTTEGATEASYRGLFGDVWLTCAVTDGGEQRLERKALLERAGDWCVAAATAATSD